MPQQRKKSLARNLGEFFGHIVKGARADPDAPKKKVIRHEVEEEDQGDVVLRRTTIEEVEFKKRRRPAEPLGEAPQDDGGHDADCDDR